MVEAIKRSIFPHSGDYCDFVSSSFLSRLIACEEIAAALKQLFKSRDYIQPLFCALRMANGGATERAAQAFAPFLENFACAATRRKSQNHAVNEVTSSLLACGPTIAGVAEPDGAERDAAARATDAHVDEAEETTMDDDAWAGVDDVATTSPDETMDELATALGGQPNAPQAHFGSS